MKKIILTILVAMIGLAAFSQPNSSQFVTWKYSTIKIGGMYQISLKATIKNGWQLYAQGADASPTPTIITFNNNPSVELVGRTTEVGKLKKTPNVWEPLKYYENAVAFEQMVKLKDNAPATVSGSIRFVVGKGSQRARTSVVNFSVEIGK